MKKNIYSIFIQSLVQSTFTEGQIYPRTSRALGTENQTFTTQATKHILSSQANNFNSQADQIASPFSFLYKPFIKDGLTSIPTSYLSLDRDYLFPGKQKGTSVQQLQNALKARLEELDLKSLKSYWNCESILSLFHYYLGTAHSGQDGISLYDRARLTAAVAISLYHNHTHPPKTTEDLYLVKGDLSGIQTYIFDVVSDGAARSLKSRSLRVQLICRLAARYILEELELTPANLLFIGGGNFYLLIPAAKHTTFVEKVIPDIENHVMDRTFFDLQAPEKLHLFLGAEPDRKSVV